MTRSPNSQIPSGTGQPATEKRDDKAFDCRQGGEANLRAATQVNAVTASSYPPAITPIQLETFPGRACPLVAKPATDPEHSEERSGPPGRCRGRGHANTAHQHNRRDPVRSGGGDSDR